MSSTITSAIAAHLTALTASGHAASTVTSRRVHLALFAEWCDARG